MYSLRIKSSILFERAAIASLANDDAGFLRSNRARRQVSLQEAYGEKQAASLRLRKAF